MSIDIKAGIKIHNRFDVEVKDVVTGEIVQTAWAENIILDQLFLEDSVLYTGGIPNEAGWAYNIFIGRGTGTISPDRTTMFDQIDVRKGTVIEEVFNQIPEPSYIKCSVVFLPSEYVGETIKEVGVGHSKLYTHALLKDSEGNSISLGPKTGTQQITIYATVYATLELPDNTLLVMARANHKYSILRSLAGKLAHFTAGFNKNVYYVMATSDGSATKDNNNYDVNLQSMIPLYSNNVGERFNFISQGVFTLPQLRIESNQGNMRIRSIIVYLRVSNDNNVNNIPAQFRMLLPNSLWTGYKFINEPIAIGDGVQKVFKLFWGDINMSKEKVFYVDSVPEAATIVETVDFVDFAVNNVSGRFVRLDMKSTNHPEQYMISEVEIYDADNNKIIPLNATSVAAFTNREHTIDDSLYTYASCNIASSTPSIAFDLGSTKIISKVRISCPDGAPLVFDLKIGANTNPAVYASNLVVDKNNFNTTEIEFENPTAAGAVISGDWWVDYIPKDENHVIDFSFTITFNEGA